MRLKRAGIITKIAVLTLVIYAAVTLVGLRVKTEAATAQQEQLRREIHEMARQNAELQHQIEHRDDDETIADIAREELGLVAPGEQIFSGPGN